MPYEKLKIMIEFPDDSLAGSYKKITKLEVDGDNGLYVYVISIEDIIMDRLRASLYWHELESKEWGMKILSHYFDQLDVDYLKTVGEGAETEDESIEIQKWIFELGKL